MLLPSQINNLYLWIALVDEDPRVSEKNNDMPIIIDHDPRVERELLQDLDAEVWNDVTLEFNLLFCYGRDIDSDEIEFRALVCGKFLTFCNWEIKCNGIQD